MATPTGNTFFWEMRSAGNVANGGAYDALIGDAASATDFSQQDAAEQVYTDIVIDGTTDTDITSVARPFVASRDEGNVINITSGTGFNTGRFVVQSVDGGGIATMDSAMGTLSSTGGNGRFGGAITMQADAFWEAMQVANQMYIKKDGTHTVPSNLVVAKDGSSGSPMQIYGYNTTRGDGPDSEANRPTIASGANTFSFDNHWSFYDIIWTTTHANGTDVDETSQLTRCKVTNSSGTSNRTAIYLGTRGQTLESEGISTNGIGIRLGVICTAIACSAHDSADGIVGAVNSATISGCISYNNSDDGILAGNRTIAYGNTCYGNNDGIQIGSVSGVTLSNNNIVGNTATGIRYTSGTPRLTNFLYNNNFHDNLADTENLEASQIYGSTTVNPGFTDPDNGDFTPSHSFHGTGAPFIGGLNTGIVSPTAIQAAARNANLLTGKL